MKKPYEITEAARGEFRKEGNVYGYDVKPGPAEDLDPVVFERLIARGIAVLSKKETKK